MAFLVLLVALWIPCAVFCGVIAEDKGHGGISWFWGGLLFGPVGLLAVVALVDRKQRRYLRLIAESQGVKIDRSEDESLHSVIAEEDIISVNDIGSAEIYNAAAKAYLRDGGKKKCSFANSEISREKVVLKDENNKMVEVMSFYDGQWLREGGMFS